MSDETQGKVALFNRAIIDPDFRRRLLEDPEATVAEEGFEIDDETMAELKAMDPEAAEEAVRNAGDGERRAAS